MGRTCTKRRKCIKDQKGYSSGSRKNIQKTSYPNHNREAQKAIKKAQKEALSSIDLLQCLKSKSNFLGVFASDQLNSLHILSYPVFLITNIDTSTENGSHWISIRIDRNRVEVFDSLGLNPSLWTSYPRSLFKFLSSYSHTHRLFVSPILQPPNTYDCGLYCIYFILYRRFVDFHKCYSKFSTILTANSSKLKQLLLHIFRK